MAEKVQKVLISDMEIAYGTQCRFNGTNNTIVEEFAEAMRAGEKVPPVILYEDDRTEGYEGRKVLIMGDGFKRRQAAMRIGLAELDAIVRKGDKFAAMQCNIEENKTALGERWTLADRRHAAKLLLAETDGASKSDRWIADLCDLDESTVSKIRHDGEAQGGPRTTRRTGRDGRQRAVPNTRARAAAGSNGAARKPKQGGPKYDWREFNRCFGVVARAPDDIVKAYPSEKGGTQCTAAVRCLETLAKVMKGWEKQLQKIKG